MFEVSGTHYVLPPIRTKECCLFFCQLTYLVKLFFMKTRIRGHNLLVQMLSNA